MSRNSEALFKVDGARLDLRTYVLFLSWAGVYIGLVIGVVSLLSSIFSTPTPVEDGAGSVLELGPFILIVSPLLGGINMFVSAIASYPIYRFVTNRFVTQRLSGWRTYESPVSSETNSDEP